jgi:regulator of protease activity HflC (stomatin/prohibitin superfamily)
LNEYEKVQTTIAEVLELNKAVLLQKAQAEVAEAQKQEHERVTSLLKQFPSELQASKVKIAPLLEQYIEQRRAYVKSKISTSITSFTDMFAA